MSHSEERVQLLQDFQLQFMHALMITPACNTQPAHTGPKGGDLAIHFHTFPYVITHCISKKNMHACLAISSAQGIFQGLARPARLHS